MVHGQEVDSIAEPVMIAPMAVEPQKPWLPFHMTLAALILVCVFFFSGTTLADPDIWWHLNNAEQIVKTHTFPRIDVYSFTANGSPWMDHEWLSEIPYYLAYKALGLRGLYLVFFVLVCSIELGILYRSYRLTGDIKNSFVITVFTVMLTVVSFGPRTLLFGWVYMLIMLFILDRFAEGNAKFIWLLPALFCLWVNSHGSWMIGLVVFGIIAGSGILNFDWGMVYEKRWSPKQVRALAIVFGLCLLALFVNPYGYKLVLYPFDMAFHQKLNISHVEEWASVDFHTVRGKVVMIMLAGIFALPFVSKTKWKLHEILLLCLALYSGLTYVRFLFLAAILISPMAAARLKLFPPYEARKDKPILNLCFIMITIAIIAIRFPSAAALQKSVDEKYPRQAIEYLRTHQITNRVLTLYLWGGYIEHYYRALPVFMDSRVDIFEYNGTLQDYLDLTANKTPLELLDKYKIEYVFFNPKEPVIYTLRHSGGWKVLYEDQISIVMQRQTN